MKKATRSENAPSSNGEVRLNEEQFTLLAIEKLVKPGWNSVHTVFSGFNEAFREYFPAGDPIKTVNQLSLEGKISSRICRGGALIAKPGVIKPIKTKEERLAETREKMGLGKKS